LSPAADALADKYPLAATVLLRAMIDFTLAKARSSRYRHAARHFMECASLASSISELGAFETHEAYATRLRAKHGRTSGFWDLISWGCAGCSRVGKGRRFNAAAHNRALARHVPFVLR
jgi:hypothetical protein